MSEKKQGDSVFTSLRSHPAPEAAHAPAGVPTPGQALGPVIERLDRLEARLTQGAAEEKKVSERTSALEARLEDAHKRLREAVEQATRSNVLLSEREAARAAAQSESEAMLKQVAATRRADDLDKRTREQMEAQRRRIDELEVRLLDAQTSRGPSPESAEALERRIKALGAEVEERLRRDLGAEVSRSQVDAAKIMAEAGVAGLRAEVRESVAKSVEALRTQTVRMLESELSARDAGLRGGIEKARDGLDGMIRRFEKALSARIGETERLSQEVRRELGAAQGFVRQTVSDLDSRDKERGEEIMGRFSAAEAAAAGARDQASQLMERVREVVAQEAGDRVRQEARRALETAVVEAVLRIRTETLDDALARTRIEAAAVIESFKAAQAGRWESLERRAEASLRVVEELRASTEDLRGDLSGFGTRLDSEGGRRQAQEVRLDAVEKRQEVRLDAVEKRVEEMGNLAAGTRDSLDKARTSLEKGLAESGESVKALKRALTNIRAVVRSVLLEKIDGKDPGPGTDSED